MMIKANDLEFNPHGNSPMWKDHWIDVVAVLQETHPGTCFLITKEDAELILPGGNFGYRLFQSRNYVYFSGWDGKYFRAKVPEGNASEEL